MSDRSLLDNLPMDLRPIVLDFVGRRMYPSLSIDIDGSRSYTVCIHGDSFKIDQEGSATTYCRPCLHLKRHRALPPHRPPSHHQRR